MNNFSDVVDAADNLSIDEQETLVEILRHRIASRNRATLVQDVSEARAEYKHSKAPSTSVEEIMDEIRRES